MHVHVNAYMYVFGWMCEFVRVCLSRYICIGVCICTHKCTCCVPYLHVRVVQMYMCTCNSLLREDEHIQSFLTTHSGWGMNVKLA